MEIYFNREHLLKMIDYPHRYRSENLLKTACVISGVIMIFLLFFKPFGVTAGEQKIDYLFISALHALAPGLILYLYFSIVNYLRAKNPEIVKWNLVHEYTHMSVLLLLMGIVSFFMRDLIYQHIDNWTWRYLWEEVRNCFAAGILLYFVLRLATFYIHSKKDDSLIFQFTPLKSGIELNDATDIIFIKTKVKQDDFSLDLNYLLFVKAAGNYIELTTYKDGLLSTDLKRISLTQFESQILGNINFFRCHRAYLVNITEVEKVSGNSQGYTLACYHTTVEIPVSRAQIEAFNTIYDQLRLSLQG